MNWSISKGRLRADDSVFFPEKVKKTIRNALHGMRSHFFLILLVFFFSGLILLVIRAKREKNPVGSSVAGIVVWCLGNKSRAGIL